MTYPFREKGIINYFFGYGINELITQKYSIVIGLS